ncbi:hypothetical protein NFI96_021650, partial [Prochilodus magdalenae]
PGSDTLQEASVSLISRSDCNRGKSYDGRITKSMICAGRPEGGVDSCQGDSGGPLVTKAGSLWWLVGDTSWGDGCGVKNKPGIYGNVTYFLEWIYEQMQLGGSWECMIGFTYTIYDSKLLQCRSTHLAHEVLGTLIADVSAVISVSRSYCSKTPGTENKSHTNRGYRHEDDDLEEPKAIKTHRTVTAGQPHSTKANKAPLRAGRNCQCSLMKVLVFLLVLGGAAAVIWYIFRLYGPDFLLQIFSNRDQKWKPVCSYGWDNTIGRDACSEFGYSGDDYVGSGKMRPGSGSSDGYMQLEPGFYLGQPIYARLTDSPSCSSDTVVTLKCIECGKSDARTRIVGGQDVTSPTRWPWQVKIRSLKTSCGGTIITPLWIVTAAHCVHDAPRPHQWKVYAGHLGGGGTGQEVNEIISHPGYHPRTQDKDIALMKLKEPLSLSSSIRPVCLPNAGLSFTTHKEYFITGWGATIMGGPGSDTLQEASISLISRSDCNRGKSYDGRITKSMICAGRPEGGVDACQGDSGGPLVTKAGSLWWLVGDTSWGDGCGVKNKPGIYGNVTYFLEWIYEQMQKY